MLQVRERFADAPVRREDRQRLKIDEDDREEDREESLVTRTQLSFRQWLSELRIEVSTSSGREAFIPVLRPPTPRILRQPFLQAHSFSHENPSLDSVQIFSQTPTIPRAES
jgi:hypothetical protein